MGGNYSKSVYNQLMEVMERLDSVEAEHKKDRKEITSLTREVNGLRRENTCLREEVSELREKTAALEEENLRLQGKLDEIRLVARAKKTLMQVLGLSEAQAHRAIEKQAMDLRLTRRAVAEHILHTYEN